MKKIFVLCALVSSLMLTNLLATTNQDFQSATVVSVENGTKPRVNEVNSSDAPLLAASYSYNVGIRLGDIVYQTSFTSAFDDVSAVFAANQALQASRKGNVLYITLPGNRMVPMAIEGRSPARTRP
jgi:hypothetical protein